MISKPGFGLRWWGCWNERSKMSAANFNAESKDPMAHMNACINQPFIQVQERIYRSAGAWRLTNSIGGLCVSRALSSNC